MGIDGYHKWMRETHPNAFSQQWLDTYDHLYIDLNFALHFSHYGSASEKEIINKLTWYIDTMISKFYPTRSIVIANDGPAPLAKLLLQRERRTELYKKTENLSASSLLFTPGTNFMNTIESKLTPYFEKIKLTHKIEIKYLIGCDGEAELKLKKQITNNINIYPNDTHIIMSNDADIIAMFGTIDTKSFYKVFICTNLGLNNKKDAEIISMGKLMDSHTEKYGITENFGLDFTFLSIILGNDYLPKIQYVDLNKIMKAYKNITLNTTKNIVIDNALKINTKLFMKLLNSIIAQTPKKKCFENFGFNDFNLNLYKNYMDGLLWCLDMYLRGECIRYNYMYENDTNPTLYGLILHMNLDSEICNLNTTIYPCISSHLYPILVMPKNALALTDQKYIKFADSPICNILYEREICVKCNELCEELEKKEDVVNTRKKINAHKSTHQRIIGNDIIEIAKEFNMTIF